jgi:hypothetical protein
MALDPLLAEIDEDYRREKMRNLWRAVGSYIITVTGLILLGTIAIVGWQSWQNTRAEGLTAQMLEARQKAQAGHTDDALAQLDTVIAEDHSTLSPLARLWAAQLAERENKEKAAAYLEPLTRDTAAQDPYHHFAHLLADDVAAHEQEALRGPFALTGHEMLGFADLDAGKTKDAAGHYRQVAEEAGTPPTLKARARLLLGTVLAGAVAPDETAP